MRKLSVSVGALALSLVAASASAAPARSARPYITASVMQTLILVEGHNFTAYARPVTIVARGHGDRVIATGQVTPTPPCEMRAPHSNCNPGWFSVTLQRKSAPCNYYGNPTGPGVIKVEVTNWPGVAPIHVVTNCGGGNPLG